MTKPKLVTPSGGVRTVVEMRPGAGVKMAFAFDTEVTFDDKVVRVPRGQYILIELEVWARMLTRAIANSEPDKPVQEGLTRQQRRAARRSN